MPFAYTTFSKSVAENFTSNGTANTETDSMFVKPGTARGIAVVLLQVIGKAAGATTLSGIAYRLKRWGTTASSAGTAITPTPHDSLAPACAATAAGASAGVTSGTGGPFMVGLAGSGVGGPGGWAARDADSACVLSAAATQSIDLFVSSGSVSLNYEAAIDHQE
jgi:hypothetical protein